MAPRSISAILWTLVSVNALSLVAGGLVTWLGYTSPVRLKQLGLLPELVILGGFSSLVVACIGLCALNYSSHHTLNIYGFSCAIFAIVLVIGLPETWQKGTHTAGNRSFLIDFAYFALLFVLIILLVFSFVFAQYLRRREREGDREGADRERLDDSDSPTGTSACTCSNHLANNKWLPSSWSNRNNLNASMNFAHRNNINHASDGSGCHLSDFRVPMYVNNPYGNQQLSGKGACCASLLNRSTADFNNSERPLQSGYEVAQPLIYKGSYQKIGSANQARSKGCSRQMRSQDKEGPSGAVAGTEETQLNLLEANNENQNDDADDDDEVEANVHVQYRSASNQCLANTITRDDSSVQYGRETDHNRYRHYYHRQQRPAPSSLVSSAAYHDDRCRCNLANVNPSSANNFNSISMLRNSYGSKSICNYGGRYSRQQISPSLQAATLPLNLASAYAIKGKPAKIKSKGSYSVMASTVAAAAALLTGVTDTSSLMQPNQGADCDGLFSGNAIVDDSALIDSNRYHFDDNTQQLGVSMLDLPETGSGFHRNICH